MCELFAMSSRSPVEVRSSLEAFARHGGLEAPHKDGWGLAYYSGEDVRLTKDSEPASGSECVRFIHEHPFVSGVVISHIRKATQGRLAMKNCQPFARELGGRMHVFAHNGDLDLARLRAAIRLEQFHPVGDTDSEYAFCALLDRLRPLWRRPIPAFHARLAAVDVLFIHGHKRSPGGGRPPRAPGLHVLSRTCAPDQQIVITASVPLTQEPGWQSLTSGELLAVRDGEIVARVRIAARELAVA